MLYLGISQDIYGAGVALSDGARLLYAANEERFSRMKNDGGFPYRSLDAAFQYTGTRMEDIAHIAMAGIMTPPLPSRIFPFLQSSLHEAQIEAESTFTRKLADFVIEYTPISHGAPRNIGSRAIEKILPLLTRAWYLPPALRRVPMAFTEHHFTHAYCAYTLSGLDDALCITADGMGDGVGTSVYSCKGGKVERVWWASSRQSLGLFFECLTEACGFCPCRDEGKLTGLAAVGDAGAVRELYPFVYEKGRMLYSGRFGLQGKQWVVDNLVRPYGRDNVAAWSQQMLEDILLQITKEWLVKTGHKNIVAGGGVFANVKLNQRLHELPGIEHVFIAPNMSDGGNAVGALCAQGKLAHQKIADVFLGEDFGEAEIEAALRAAKLDYAREPEIADAIGERLAANEIVGRFDGRMEWGPRALGNRSILASAKDPKLVERLNGCLKRNDFMPFAPAMLEEAARRYIVQPDNAWHAAEYMTVCFNCTDAMKAEFPAVVHADGTARAQIVRHETNPAFHAIINAYNARSGAPVVLNTSFNIHEEPIVRTPEEAIRAFLQSRIDWLALGPFLVKLPA